MLMKDKKSENYGTKFLSKKSAKKGAKRDFLQSDFVAAFSKNIYLGWAVILLALLILINVFGWLLGIFARVIELFIIIAAAVFIWKYFTKGKK